MATKVFPHFQGLVLVLEGAVHLEIPAASETGPSTIFLDLFPRLASFLLGYSPRPALFQDHCVSGTRMSVSAKATERLVHSDRDHSSLQ